MSNETDLDWLARNVHVWPAGAAFVRIHTNGNEPVFVTEFGAACGGDVFTRSQWLARRADLQNKPSWDDAPEWANWMAQSPRGHWEFFSANPRANHLWMYSVGERSLANDIANPGAILGDWRNTLERRPESPEKFKPITSIEDNQEQDMTPQATTQQAEKQPDNSWFERGELPPVGEVVTLNSINPNNYWAHHVGAKLTIVSHDKDTRGTGIAVYRIVDRDGFNEYHGLVAHAFRPIRTERELAIEEMMKTINVIDFVGTPHHLASEISAIMYDSGYRKDPK